VRGATEGRGSWGAGEGEDRYPSHAGLASAKGVGRTERCDRMYTSAEVASDAQSGQRRRRRLRSLALLAPLQELCPTVPSGSWRGTHHVKHFASKAEVTSIYLGGWNLVALTVSGLVRPARR